MDYAFLSLSIGSNSLTSIQNLKTLELLQQVSQCRRVSIGNLLVNQINRSYVTMYLPAVRIKFVRKDANGRRNSNLVPFEMGCREVM